MYDNWEELEKSIDNCQKCKLCNNRKNIVESTKISNIAAQTTNTNNDNLNSGRREADRQKPAHV